MWNQDYYGVNSGLVTGLELLGALSVDGAYSSASDNGSIRTDDKLQLGWNWQLDASKTGLRFNWSR